MISRQMIVSVALTFLTPCAIFGKASCPGNAEPIPYHLDSSMITIPVTVNGSGPYDFILDTGAQISVIEPSLASELELSSQGSIGLISGTGGHHTEAQLVSAELIQAGPYAVSQSLVAVESLARLQALSPKVRGILGETFLGRFDLLIDYVRKSVCLDETRQMQQELRGERIPLVAPREARSDLPLTSPYLISVRLQGDGNKGTILRLDSGANAPILFANRLETPPWLQKTHAIGLAAGNGAPVSYAIMSSQYVRIGVRLVRQIAFVTPINSRQSPVTNVDEDGLLPTNLFHRVFISYTDHFVVFDPQ